MAYHCSILLLHGVIDFIQALPQFIKKILTDPSCLLLKMNAVSYNTLQIFYKKIVFHCMFNLLKPLAILKYHQNCILYQLQIHQYLIGLQIKFVSPLQFHQVISVFPPQTICSPIHPLANGSFNIFAGTSGPLIDSKQGWPAAVGGRTVRTVFIFKLHVGESNPIYLVWITHPSVQHVSSEVLKRESNDTIQSQS